LIKEHIIVGNVEFFINGHYPQLYKETKVGELQELTKLNLISYINVNN